MGGGIDTTKGRWENSPSHGLFPYMLTSLLLLKGNQLTAFSLPLPLIFAHTHTFDILVSLLERGRRDANVVQF